MKGETLRYWLVAVFVTIAFGWGSAAQAATTRTVCPVGVADFPSIQAAISNVVTVDGDTLSLCADTFPEGNITVNKSLTIMGQGPGNTIIDPGAAVVVLRVDADDVIIKDLTIQNGLQAIRFEKAGGTIDNAEINNVHILEHSSNGIEIHNQTTVTNLLIKDSRFANSSDQGRGLRVSSSGHLDGAEFRDSIFDGLQIGIYEANDGNTSTMKNVLVTGSTFQNITAGQGTAIFLEEIQDALIEKNTFLNNRRDIQIFKWYQAAIPVKNVVIRNNTMTGTTNAVFAIFNAHHTSGQTRFDGVSFIFNTANTADGSAVFAGAHSTFQNSDPSSGGVGWETVLVRCNTFTGITTGGNGVRFFVPTGIDDDQALGGASIAVAGNWWGSADEGVVGALMQLPGITNFLPILGSPPTENCSLTDPDHFLSYSLSGNGGDDDDSDSGSGSGSGGSSLKVDLTDQFGSGTFKVKEAVALYNPADKNGEGVTDENTHLVGYKITPSGGDDEGSDDDSGGGSNRFSVRIDNQFGALYLDTRNADRLLVPSLKNLSSPIPDENVPAKFSVDHFKCYGVSRTSGKPRFKRRQVTMDDQFTDGPKKFDVRKPTRLCNPVEKQKDDEITPIQNPDLHLLCYEVRVARGEPKHQKVKGLYVNNQFGLLQLDTKKEKELCVPSQKTVVGSPSDGDDDSS